RFCRMCGECRGTCPNGLAVSDLVRVAMYSEGYGNKELARHHFEAIPAAQRRSVCDLCSECSVHCRNGVAVRERILRAQQVVA
ncbi:MAG TPA: hypothetical protein VEC99_09235, partial [Clostridia bacterium]|nr:hypothetical protein [Clostridia bacterium]